MNDYDELGPLAGTFVMLSLLAVGGINTVVPEIHRIAVDAQGWMTDSQFLNLYAISQAAPGPNLIVVTLVGWQVAGWVGATVATLAIVVPSAVLTYLVTLTWNRFREARWRKAVQAGMIPVTVGLIAAAAFVIAVTVSDGNWRLLAVTVATAAVIVLTKVHPLIPLAVAGAVGYAGLI